MKPDPTNPQMLLHLEGAALFIGSLVLYAELGVSWWLFVLLFLAPDLSLLAYLGRDKRLAAMDLSREDVERLIADRAAARAERDWTRADTIRDRLTELGIAVMDRADGGVEWRVRLD